MKIIIVGCGRMGAGLAHDMVRRGHTVTVIDKSRVAFERLGASFRGETIEGIGFDRGVLLNAGIERADGVAAVTESDEVNAVIARVARQVFHVPRVVARLYDPRKAEIYRRFDLETIAPVSWGVSRMADLLSFSRLDSVLNLGTGEVDIIEIEIPPLLNGRRVNDVTIPGEVHLVAVSRAGKTFLPMSGTVFQPGDRIYLAVSATSVDRLNQLLELT